MVGWSTFSELPQRHKHCSRYLNTILLPTDSSQKQTYICIIWQSYLQYGDSAVRDTLTYIMLLHTYVWLVACTHTHTRTHAHTHACTHTHNAFNLHGTRCDITCQLTRVERFSIMSLCSVRVGGPYLHDVARRGKKEVQCLPTANTGA